MRGARIVLIGWLAMGAAVAAAQSPPAPSPYQEKVRNAGRLVLAGDYNGATAALTEAVQLDASQPDAFYYLGVVKRLRNDVDGALSDFRTAARLAGETDDVLFQARALQAIAETLERVPARFEEARTAWADFVRFADGHRNVANPEIGRARTQAILSAVDIAQTYAPVRARIAERDRQAAGTQSRPNR